MRYAKKLLSLALSGAMALSLLPGAALAAEDRPERGTLSCTEAISPRYDGAQPFSEGLAAVKRNGKWGYIDPQRKTVIPFDYDLAYEFSEGLAVVGRLVKTESRENEVWDPEAKQYVKDGTTSYQYTYELGFINKSNKAVWLADGASGGKDRYIQLVTDSQEIQDSTSYLFHNGYLVIPDSKTVHVFNTAGKAVELSRAESYLDEAGKQQTKKVPLDPCAYPVNEGFAVTCQGYYDLSSGALFDPRSDKEIAQRLPFNQGLAPVWVRDGELLSLGFIDTSGQWAIQPFPADTYWVSGGGTAFRAFGETGLCMVSDRQKRFGAIDKTGQTVIPFQYENLLPAAEGRIAFQQNGKCGYLSAATLAVEIPARYDQVTSFYNGLAVAREGDRTFLIGWDGQPVPGGDKLDPSVYFRPTPQGKTGCYPPDEYVVIQEGGKYGYGHVQYLPALPQRSDMSPWAYDDVSAAIQAELIPVRLQNMYRREITREEFCSTAIQAITKILDTDAEALVLKRTRKSLTDWQRTYPFQDTSDPNIIAAYALKIVAGRDNKMFDPYSPISRQEAAAFLHRSAQVLRLKVPSAGEDEPFPFADVDEIADWAREPVAFVDRAGVMSGTGEGRFSPLDLYSREQAFATFYRLYQAMEQQ